MYTVETNRPKLPKLDIWWVEVVFSERFESLSGCDDFAGGDTNKLWAAIASVTTRSHPNFRRS